MANVHFFGRLSNLWKGFISLWLEDIEKKQPEIAYENAVQSMTDKYVRLKQATASIIRRREELESRLSDEQKELAQVTADLNAAIDSSQDDLAVLLIQKKNAVQASIDELNESLTQAKGDADDAKASLMSVKAEIGKLKLTGFVAWMAWLLVHIYYLINFKNRLFVLVDWAWSYLAYERGSRLITGHRLQPGAPAEGES